MDIIKKIRNTISRCNMLTCGDTVIVGLSGGADSVCLLLCLEALREELGISLCAVHVNHCLRGEESDRDELFCRRLCEDKGIPFEAFRVDVLSLVSSDGLSVEAAARELRYNAFETAAKKYTDVKIATAHNKCDNTETMLFNFTRGTGTKGMCGIPYVRGKIIRPILDISREEIEEFLNDHGQGYVTDSTNLTEDYSRNKLRHQVIPLLSQINPAVHEAASRLSRNALEDEEFFEKYLSQIQEESICSYPAAIRKRYIRRCLCEHNIECSYERLSILDELMLSRKNTRYNLSGNIFAVFRNGIMTVESCEVYEKSSFSQELSLNCREENVIEVFDKRVIISGIEDDILSDNAVVNKNLTNNYINCAKIQGVAVLRNKRDGDSIILKGRNFSTKLKKLYNSMKLSPKMRSEALVIEDSEGLIWSEYGGVSSRTAVSAGDKADEVIRIRIK